MSTTEVTDKPQIVQREVGEHVKLTLNVDAASTKDLGEGTLEAVVTTSSLDRHGENIITSGIDTSQYMQNPVVLYGHDYYGLPIGKTLKLTEQKTKMKARFQLATDILPFAKTVYDMVKAGYINAVSIGGIVREWSDDYKTIQKMDMLEFSIVSIPANPEAMITGKSFEQATGKTMEQVADEFEEAVQLNILDKVKHFGDDDTNDAINVLKKLVAVLEASASASSAGEGTPETIKRIKKITLVTSAKAVVTQSQRVIKTIKLTEEGHEYVRESNRRGDQD